MDIALIASLAGNAFLLGATVYAGAKWAAAEGDMALAKEAYAELLDEARKSRAKIDAMMPDAIEGKRTRLQRERALAKMQATNARRNAEKRAAAAFGAPVSKPKTKNSGAGAAAK